MKVEVRLDDKCEETTVTITAQAMTEEVNELLSRLSNQYPSLITGFLDDRLVVIEASEIIRVYASRQKVFIIAEACEYTTRLRLYQLEERLSGNGFVRISNFEIINLKKIRDFDLSFAGNICVRFRNGTTTYVSRR